jgi:ATP-dependent Clp protease ATP-binding subunit ClpB
MATAAKVVLNPARRGPKAESLLRGLRARVVGQNEALEAVVDAYQTLLAGLNSPARPLANFLFLGPTGTGKTHVVEALAEELFHDPGALLRIDCAEFQHSHEIAKLVGSPPGYLGHRETHPVLTQEALDRCHTPDTPVTLVLFDEIEKASDALWQLLLGILDKAALTLGDNRKVSFARCFIFLTSNLGAGEMQSLLQPGMGFAPPAGRDTQRRLDGAAVGAARRRFSPEFFNRLDRVVVFRPLERTQLERVLDLELGAIRARLQAGAGAGNPALEFRCTAAARDFLLREGADATYGARHLKRALERLLVAPLASLIATRQVGGAERLIVDHDPAHARLEFVREAAAGHAA